MIGNTEIGNKSGIWCIFLKKFSLLWGQTLDVDDNGVLLDAWKHAYSGRTPKIWADISIAERSELILIRGNLNVQIYTELTITFTVVRTDVWGHTLI